MWQRKQHLQQLQAQTSELSNMREPFSKTLTNALEKLALRAECPWPNKTHSCTLTLPIALIREHQEECEYGPVLCPLRKLFTWRWMGPFEEVKHHVTQKHRNWVTNISGMTDVLTKIFKIINYTSELFF